MHSSPINMWQFILIFMLFYFEKEIKFWLIHYRCIDTKTCVSKFLDSHRFTRCLPFWFFNPFEYLLVQFSSGPLASNTYIHVFYYLFSPRSYLLLYFQIRCSSFFVEILSFVFYLVKYECCAYLIIIDHSLVYGWYPKTILLFFSLIVCIIQF